MMDFLSEVPKIELHAHLNGSLSKQTIAKLNEQKYGSNYRESDIYQKVVEPSIDQVTELSEVFQLFKYAHILTETPELLSTALESVIAEFNAENTIYLELRSTPKETEHMTIMDYLQTIIETIKNCQIKYPNITVKFLPSIDRSRPLSNAANTIAALKQLKQYIGANSIIVGLDLSGNPAAGDFEELKPILSDAKEMGLKLSLHSGESNDSKSLSEAEAMLYFGIDRIGHGTFIADNAKLMQMAREKLIPFEVCITSNIKCKTVASNDTHHLRMLYASKHPVVVCTDDYGIFNTSLTNEYRIAQITCQLNNRQMFDLIKRSVNYIFGSQELKSKLLTKFNNFETAFFNEKE